MILDLARRVSTVTAIPAAPAMTARRSANTLRVGSNRPPTSPVLRDPSLIRPFEAYLRERLERFPELTGRRLWRELARARLRGRLLHRHRVPARRPAGAAQGVRAPLRDPARQAGPGGLRLDRVARIGVAGVGGHRRHNRLDKASGVAHKDRAGVGRDRDHGRRRMALALAVGEVTAWASGPAPASQARCECAP